jgi:proline iminopeptidase
MTALYPPIEPHAHGMLDVGDGNRLYWEACGNPQGKPALVLHGGPGSGCTPGMRRFFDPARYRIVLFDQRNCGRSTPHASDPATNLDANTTPHLLTDIELLRTTLGIDRWLVFGMSWGSTLALAYAESHPGKVSEIVLAAVTTTRPAEIDWLYHGAGRFFPGAWERFRDGVPPAERDGNLVEAYARLLEHPDPTVCETAAAGWCAWEDAVVATDPEAGPNPRYADARFRMAFARIVTHYFRHNAWLEDGQLLRDAGRLSGIPGVLIHGRLDISSPLSTAWELVQAWPGSDLVVVERSGHSSAGHGMAEAMVAATDGFAATLS